MRFRSLSGYCIVALAVCAAAVAAWTAGQGVAQPAREARVTAASLSEVAEAARDEDSGPEAAGDEGDPEVMTQGDWVPEALRDPVFARYVDLSLLSQAWESKNASQLTDVALQAREGEKNLFRSHRGFSSDELFDKAARIAVAEKNDETLQRLAKIAETIASPELKAHVAALRKLESETRGAEPVIKISANDLKADVDSATWDLFQAIRDARWAGDLEALADLEKQLAAGKQIPAEQRPYFEKLLQESRTTAQAMSDRQKDLGKTLDKLVEGSRGRGGAGHYGPSRGRQRPAGRHRGVGYYGSYHGSYHGGHHGSYHGGHHGHHGGHS